MMTSKPGYQSLRVLLLLLSCMSSDKPWHTCMFGQSLADNSAQSDGKTGGDSASTGLQKIFGHVKVWHKLVSSSIHSCVCSKTHVTHLLRPTPFRGPKCGILFWNVIIISRVESVLMLP